MIQFKESTHEYICNNEKFLSVTTLLHKFQEPVNWEEVAKKKAIKEGIPYEDLLAQWEEKRNKAAQKGTDFHKKVEDFLVKKGYREDNSKKYPICNVATINDIKTDVTQQLNNNTVYVEKMIWSNLHKICGTADLVEVVDNTIHIKDYKTNEKLVYSSWVNPKTRKSKRLLPPLAHLDDCNISIYYLQLNMYMYMLLQQNPKLKMGTMSLLHIIFEEEKPVSYTSIPVPNMQKEVKAILKHYQKYGN